jgi:hypothetical protein
LQTAENGALAADAARAAELQAQVATLTAENGRLAAALEHSNQAASAAAAAAAAATVPEAGVGVAETFKILRLVEGNPTLVAIQAKVADKLGAVSDLLASSLGNGDDGEALRNAVAGLAGLHELAAESRLGAVEGLVAQFLSLYNPAEHRSAPDGGGGGGGGGGGSGGSAGAGRGGRRSGGGGSTAAGAADLSLAAELSKVTKERDSATKKMARLRTVYKEYTDAYKGIVYRLTGYHIDADVGGQKYFVQSMYAEREEDCLIFQESDTGELSVLGNEYAQTHEELVRVYWNQFNSFPGLLGQLTLNLLENTTRA